MEAIGAHTWGQPRVRGQLRVRQAALLLTLNDLPECLSIGFCISGLASVR